MSHPGLFGRVRGESDFAEPCFGFLELVERLMSQNQAKVNVHRAHVAVNAVGQRGIVNQNGWHHASHQNQFLFQLAEVMSNVTARPDCSLRSRLVVSVKGTWLSHRFPISIVRDAARQQHPWLVRDGP